MVCKSQVYFPFIMLIVAASFKSLFGQQIRFLVLLFKNLIVFSLIDIGLLRPLGHPH